MDGSDGWMGLGLFQWEMEKNADALGLVNGIGGWVYR